jgi:hypothetical protein
LQSIGVEEEFDYVRLSFGVIDVEFERWDRSRANRKLIAKNIPKLVA